MFPLPHIIFSTILSIILYPFIGNNVIIVWTVSIFIDVDHYLWYIINEKSWNLVDAYTKHKLKAFLNIKYKFHLFHIIELLIIVGLLGFYNKIFLYIFIGMLFHYIIDWIDICLRPYIKKQRTWSLIMYFKRKWNT